MKEEGRPLRIAVPVPDEKDYGNYFDALAGLGAEGAVIGADASPAAFDGLLLPGGGDVDPARYRRANDGSRGIDPALDALQFAAAERFIEAGIPVFGICRGHQVLNVLFGGTLIQDLGGRTHARDEGSAEDKVHPVTAEKGSWLEEIYGSVFCVNSSHHQAVETPGEGLVLDLYAAGGIPEALHHRTKPVWSVQWHPERMCFAHRRADTVDGQWVLARFLERCGERRG